MVVPQGYDPVTLNHWLWFKYRCHEGSPQDFQKLFEDIAKRAKPEFMQIRPYGNIGDRKCDGLFRTNGTVFQVYSPDELKLDEVRRKIDEDLDGAVRHWGNDIEKWVFVYNARRGLAPDIPLLLAEKQRQYGAIQIEHLSSDALWEMARGLNIQQRAEVLGPPTGYEHLFMAQPLGTSEAASILDKSWFVIVQDVLSPINLRSVVDALQPDLPFGAPVFIRPTPEGHDWTDAARHQCRVIQEAMDKARDVLPRFAVFSLAPIPLVIHLGFKLSERVEVQSRQFDRISSTWRWPEIQQADTAAATQISGLPSAVLDDETDVVVRVSLSATISSADTRTVVETAAVEVDLTVPQPSVLWLKNVSQLRQIAEDMHTILTAIRDKVPRCRQIHLFYAGPTGGAITIGQRINPRMNPPVALYEYSQQQTPRYRRVLTLAEDLQ